MLLLEAGGTTLDGPMTEQSVPAGATDNVGFENVDWKYRVEQQKTALAGASGKTFGGGFRERGRSFPIPRGKVLGGSNELNYMLHVRGTAGDYESWEAATGDARWGAASMAAAEHYYEERVEFASKAAPKDGSAPHASKLADAWVAAAGQSEFGNTSSYNDGPRLGGFHFEHAVRRGVRQSTARQFLLPLLRQGAPNLDVVVGAYVNRVLLDDGASPPRATGVDVSFRECMLPSVSVPVLGQLLPSRPCLLGSRQATRREFTKAPGYRREVFGIRVSARKEVIVSAGAYESPHLLLRSGVGPSSQLRAANVRQYVELPAVGKHLQDHPIIGLKYRLGPVGGAWLPTSITKLWLAFPAVLWSYLTSGKGVLASSGCDIGYFGMSNLSFARRPDIQMHGMLTAGDPGFFANFLNYDTPFTSQLGEPSDYSSLWAQGLVVAPTLLHAAAEGSVTLDHRNADGSGPPVIQYEAFGHDEDVLRLTKGIRQMQTIMAQPAMAAHDPTLLHIADLAAEFGRDSDEYWAQYIKRFGFVVYHPAGTCRMGRAGEPSAVVDSSLRVLGVEQLRVADASIMPDITSGNTQVPTAAIGVQMVAILRERYT